MILRRSPGSLAQKILALIMTAALGVVCFGGQGFAYAAEIASSDLELSLAVDQLQYAKDDVATVTLNVSNNTGETHYDVKHEFAVPNGLEIVENTSASASHGDISHGDSSIGTVKLKLASSNAAALQGTSLAQTGDPIPLVEIALVVMLMAIAACLLAKRYRKQTLSAILAFGMIACGISFPTLALAKENVTDHSASNSITLNFDGKDYVVGVSVSSQTKTNSSSDDSGNGDQGAGSTPSLIYQDDVKVIEGESWENNSSNGLSIVVPVSVGKEIGVGDKIAAEPNADNPFGTCMIVTSVEETDEGMVIRGVEPSLDDIVKSIYDSGTSSTGVQVVPAEGVEVESSSEESVSPYASSRAFSFGIDESGTVKGDTLKFNIKKYNLSFSLTPSLDYVVDYRIGDLRELSLAFNLEQKASANFEAKNEFEHELAALYFPTNIPGLWIKADAVAKFSISGSMEISVKNVTTVGFKYKSGKPSWICENDPKLNVGFDAKLRAAIGVEAGVTILGKLDLAKGTFEDGVSFKPEKPVVRENGSVCVDLTTTYDSSLKLSLLEGAITKSHKLNETKLGRIHSEDFEIVDKCTWDDHTDDSDNPSDVNPSNPDKDDPIPSEPEYGTEVKWVQNKEEWDIEEPFYVFEGTSLYIPHSTWENGVLLFVQPSLAWDIDKGSVVRETLFYKDGSTYSSTLIDNASIGTGFGWDCIGAKYEVLKGKMLFRGIHMFDATEPPELTFGACELSGGGGSGSR